MSQSTTLPPLNKPTGKHEGYAAQAKNSLLGTPPAPSDSMASLGVQNVDDVMDGSVATLSVNDIDCYDHNPRTQQNPRYAEIKASIAANHIQNQISVTRRPGHKRYTVYGGGNTRLTIAKELFAQGDARFATLTVIVRKWQGESNVVTSHLVENELRGDISFWEKAAGIADIRKFLNDETGRQLKAPELHNELRKRHGLNFGARTISNMLFAVDQLAPIGQWLTAAAVNQHLRPAFLSIFDVAAKLDRSGDVKDALTAVLHQHAARLATLETERLETDKSDVNADETDPASLLKTEQLLSEINSAAAKVFGYDPRKLLAMRKALAANPKIAHETLTLISADLPENTSSAGDATSSTNTAKQESQPKPKRDSNQDSKAGAVQQPQNVPTSTTGPQHPQPTAATTSTASSSGAASATTEVADQQTLRNDLIAALAELNDLVFLGDFVFQTENKLPLNLYIDFPAEGFGSADGMILQPELAHYRAAVWRLLVANTGQLDRRYTQIIDPLNEGKECLWRSAFDRGETVFHQKAESLLGEPLDSAGQDDMHLLFTKPEIRRAVVRVLSKIDSYRSIQKELDGFVPLFAH